MFRKLNEQEIKEFQQWADENYVPGGVIQQTWHPVVQMRCAEINQEALVELKQAEDSYKTIMKDLDEIFSIFKVPTNL